VAVSALKAKIQQDARDALRARAEGKVRLQVLRLLLSEIQRVEIDRRVEELDDEAVIAVISRSVRQRKETSAEAMRLGRTDVAAAANMEADILREYLPEAITAEALAHAVEDAILQSGATGPADTGRVMAALMPTLRGRVEGAVVQAAVRQRLGGG